MKPLSIIAVLFLITASGFSQKHCPSSYKVNNGNGTCGLVSQLRLNYPDGCPDEIPFIDSVYSNGELWNITFSAPDVSQCRANNGYISYCITSGNVPPAITWTIYFAGNNGIGNKCQVTSAATVVLPVKFVSFDATFTGNSINCKWTTEAELNNHHFELERSFDGNDFTTAAFIFNAENAANTRNDYSYKDNSEALKNRSIVFYRVKQVDIDGKTTYSNIVTVKKSASASSSIQISPNPFTELLAIKFESAESGIAAIKILTLTGQPVSTKNAIATKGSNNIRVANLGNLSKGVYLVQISINGVFAGNQKVIKN